ncbi:serine/threonine protein kinase [Parashewanella spongiae]|uniref:Stress response kinase A n=1 Tax=Parashewanella spongiae TaxID=342950 RepID=A0A3A6UGT5_9GAMM|nr:serine/threonine protein kinase [Parashewanella spongiae]RJY18156.1 serine/threonine protein kinase [Parashewanella spongiae]
MNNDTLSVEGNYGNQHSDSIIQTPEINDVPSAGFHYQSLTPDSILDAIESIGIYPETGLLALNSYENRVYQFRSDDGKRYVVKFYRPERWSDKQIIEEHEFSYEIADAEVPLALPLTINGTTLHEHNGFKFSLFPSIGGRNFEVDNLEHLEIVGHFIGRLHQCSMRQDFDHRPMLTPKNMGDDAIAWLRDSGHIPQSLAEPFFTIVEHVLSEAKSIWMNIDCQHIRLHGDLHPGNILWTPDGPGFVDLDDARSGPAIQDLWMMLTGDRTQQTMQLEILLEAYEDFCEFDTQQLKLIEPLRALRMLYYNAWISRRWDDPAFPMHFPWFNTEKYWEQQILAFKEQLSALNEPPLTLIPY